MKRLKDYTDEDWAKAEHEAGEGLGWSVAIASIGLLIGGLIYLFS